MEKGFKEPDRVRHGGSSTTTNVLKCLLGLFIVVIVATIAVFCAQLLQQFYQLRNEVEKAQTELQIFKAKVEKQEKQAKNHEEKLQGLTDVQKVSNWIKLKLKNFISEKDQTKYKANFCGIELVTLPWSVNIHE